MRGVFAELPAQERQISVIGRKWRAQNRVRAAYGAGNLGKIAPAMTETPSQKPHIPVMLNEVMRALSPSSGDVMVDATFGAGGYTSAILNAGAKVVAIDRDPNAISAGEALVSQHEGNLSLQHGRFSNLDALAQVAGYSQVDGVVADIGVSSMQIDQAERGFSFQKDGPLDMRMEQAGVSAADVVNTCERSDLTRIIGILGEERQASRVSAEIAERRLKEPFSTTLDLANLVEKTLGRKAKDRIHPATRTFQALRIFVNRELEELADALLAAERVLKPGGRIGCSHIPFVGRSVGQTVFSGPGGKLWWFAPPAADRTKNLDVQTDQTWCSVRFRI